MLKRVRDWFIDDIGARTVGAILGSAAVTSATSAAVRHFQAMSWEASWVLWTSSAFTFYILLLWIFRRFRIWEREAAASTNKYKPGLSIFFVNLLFAPVEGEMYVVAELALGNRGQPSEALSWAMGIAHPGSGQIMDTLDIVSLAAMTTVFRRKDRSSLGFVVAPHDILPKRCMGKRIYKDDAITGVLLGRFRNMNPSSAEGCLIAVSCRDETGAEVTAASQIAKQIGKEPAWEGTTRSPSPNDASRWTLNP